MGGCVFLSVAGRINTAKKSIQRGGDFVQYMWSITGVLCGLELRLYYHHHVSIGIGVETDVRVQMLVSGEHICLVYLYHEICTFSNSHVHIPTYLTL